MAEDAGAPLKAEPASIEGFLRFPSAGLPCCLSFIPTALKNWDLSMVGILRLRTLGKGS